MQRQLHRSSFLIGASAGIVLTSAAGLMMGQTVPTRPTERTSQYFVTGDSINATVWRLEADFSLVCVSRNTCRGTTVP